MMKIIDIAFTNLKPDETWNSPKMRSSRDAKSTLVIPDDFPAVAAARIADVNDVRFILVVAGTNTLAGLLLPAWTRRQIGRMQSRQFTTLTEALEAYESDPKAQKRNYHSEWLNSDRPEMYWCNAGHSVDRCPCAVQAHHTLGCSADN